MSICRMIEEARVAVARANFKSDGHTVKLTTVYLGLEEFSSFIADPESGRSMACRFGAPHMFHGVEVIEVSKMNHVGYAWADSRVLPS